MGSHKEFFRERSWREISHFARARDRVIQNYHILTCVHCKHLGDFGHTPFAISNGYD
jgi:hypothetical protein